MDKTKRYYEVLAYRTTRIAYNYSTAINYAAWTGSICMVVFSFTLMPPIGIAGLTLLTVQSISRGLHNLTAINLLSICGLILAMI